MLLLVSALLFTYASADNRQIHGPIGSVSNLLKLTHFYKFLNNELKSEFENNIKNEEYPSIENLHEYLEPFKNCFVHMTNHRSVEIHPTNIPIVLTEIEAQLIRNTNTSTWLNVTNELITIVQKQSQFPQTGKLKSEDFSCNSNFQVRMSETWIRKFSGYCLAINHKKFVMNTRPWSCEVRFDMFLPIYQTKYNSELHSEWLEYFYLKIHPAPIELWHYPWSTNTNKNETTRKLIPSSLPVIKINIITATEYEHWFQNNVYMDWIFTHVDPIWRTRLGWKNERLVTGILG